MEKIRLSKYLSQNGVCSRRTADLLIEDGRVVLNGKKAVLGDKIDPERDKLLINGKPVRYRPKRRSYFVLYKPRGYVTTMSDESGRKCISDLIDGISSRVYYVGRLDKDSEGLILLTDDGELASNLMHPSKNIPKTYKVTVEGIVPLDVIKKLRKGVELDDNYLTKEAMVKVMAEKEDRTDLSITIFEGKNRQIRRMCTAVGLNVLRLKRVSLGRITLGRLAVGKYRMLSEEEIDYLKSL